MDGDILKNETRKARKPHTCFFCGETIEKGETYHYQSSIWDNTVWEFHEHLKCHDISIEIWDYCDLEEGMSDEDFQDACKDICQEFVCPDCPKWNNEIEDWCDDDEYYCLDKLYEFFKTHELYKAGKNEWGTVFWKVREKGVVR